MPVAHALLQIREEIARVPATLSHEQLWRKPTGAGSVAFHLTHLAGSLDRLLTYARGEALNEAQKNALDAEATMGGPHEDVESLRRAAVAAIDRALDQVRATPLETLRDAREVGTKRLPSTVLGLLFHAAEHAQRHAGQLATTVKLVTS
jgi:uncharacterized damage-inducible protein DinB